MVPGTAMTLRFLPLACLLAAVARADHGGLADFDRLTGRWDGGAKTPVANEQVDLSWAPDDSALLFALGGSTDRRLIRDRIAAQGA